MNRDTTVSVNIWTMDSDDGYVPSSGYGRVCLVDRERIANLLNYEDLLFDVVVEEPPLREEQLDDPKRYLHTHGACRYRGVSGTCKVPQGMVAVQLEYYNICTRDGPEYYARVLNPEDLAEYYRSLATRYTELSEISERGEGL